MYGRPQNSNEYPARTVDECLLDVGVGSRAETKVSPIPSSHGFTVVYLVPCVEENSTWIGAHAFACRSSVWLRR